MKSVIATGLSLPLDLFTKIELERGDISRSRFLLRLLEKALNENQKGIGETNPNTRPRTTNEAVDTSGLETDRYDYE